MASTTYRLLQNVMSQPSFERWLPLALALLVIVASNAPIGGGGGVG